MLIRGKFFFSSKKTNLDLLYKSRPSTIGTLDDQSISIHFTLPGDRQRVLHIPVPKASHTKIDKLRDFLAATLKHQSVSLESIAKSGYQFVQTPELADLSALEHRARKRRSSPPLAPSEEREPSPPHADEEPARKNAKLLQQLLYTNLIGDGLTSDSPKRQPQSIIDDLFGKR